MTAIDSPDSDLTLADLIADAARVHLPAPRTPAAPRVIDLTVPAQSTGESRRTIEIPEAGISLVESFADYGA